MPSRNEIMVDVKVNVYYGPIAVINSTPIPHKEWQGIIYKKKEYRLQRVIGGNHYILIQQE